MINDYYWCDIRPIIYVYYVHEDGRMQRQLCRD